MTQLAAPVPRASRGRFGAALVALAVGAAGLAAVSAAPAAAIPECDPLDPDPAPICGPVFEDPPFTPPEDGFEWSRPVRFDGSVASFRWDQASATHDPGYVHPSAWAADFDACATEADATAAALGAPTANTYTWVIRGETIARQSCLLRYDRFPTQGTYEVELTVSGPDAAGPVTQEVAIRDILIVSIGDSYASGEGNPDAPIVVDQPAQWVDRRCHRSRFGGPAVAAANLERTDPHTSVTFLSFACSGATIARPYFVPSDDYDYYSEDRDKPLGVGVLAPYRGTEPNDLDDYDETEFLPSQIDQLVAAATCAEGSAGCPFGERRIDALLVSGGGNDMGFGPIAASCVFHQDCSGNATVSHWVSGAGQVNLSTRFEHDASLLPGIYGQLADALDETGLNIAETYLTEYPDPTTTNDPDDADGSCDRMLEDTNGLPFVEISDVETRWAREVVLSRLNDEVAAATLAHDWNLVDGISSQFVGHGYCAPDGQRWIRRASESVTMQGPDDAAKTTGTLHPTAEGHRAFATRIIEEVSPDLAILPVDDGPPAGEPPVAPPPLTVATPPLGGPPAPGLGYRAESLCPPGMVLTGIRGETRVVAVSTTVAVAGAVCAGPDEIVVGSPQSEGPPMGDAAGGTTGQTVCPTGQLVVGIEGRQGDFVDQIGVRCRPADLTGDATPATPFGGAGGTPAGPFDCPAGQPAVGINGEVIDWNPDHLRSVSLVCLAVETDEDMTPPTVSCAGADGSWHATDVAIACTAADDGSGLADPVDASFSLTTSVPDGTETADATTGSREVCDAAGNCATAGPVGANLVDKRGPTVTFTTPADGATHLLGADVDADYGCGDGGSGLTSCEGTVPSGAAIDTSTVGPHSVTVTGTDQVGNATTVSHGYEVHYDFSGFGGQLSAALARVNAGQVVPVTFSLSGNHGLDVLAAGWPRSADVACGSTAPVDDGEVTENPRPQTLTYDAGGDTYTYLWKTDRAWRGTCRQFVIQLADGTVHRATVTFAAPGVPPGPGPR
jgi:hypothetical protein